MNEPRHQEINHQTIKLLIGVIAISLGSLTNLFADKPLASISASYFEGGWSQTFLVGFLFAIAAFLAAYNGYSKLEMILAKVAACAAAGVAMFPCNCEEAIGNCKNDVRLVPGVHGASAAVMFVILVVFCVIFYKRAKAKHEKGNDMAKRRLVVYATCATVIVLAMLAILLDGLAGGLLPRMVWYGETAALVAFGISWITASRTLPMLAKPEERLWGKSKGSDGFASNLST